ncbi:choline transporter-like protein 4 [Centroberyx gerrardi]
MLPPDAYESGSQPKNFFDQRYCDPSLDLATTELSIQKILDEELCPSFYVPSLSTRGKCLPSLSALNYIPSNFTLPGMVSINHTLASLTDAIGSCTDMLCSIIFLLAVTGFIALGVIAWLLGDSRNILLPRDSGGMFCGAGKYLDRPNMLYVDLLKCETTTNVMPAALDGIKCPTMQVCVSKCPSEFWMLPPDAYESGSQPKNFFDQRYCDPSLDLATTELSIQKILDEELCPSFYVPSLSTRGKCLPSLSALNYIPSNFTLPGMVSINHTLASLTDAIGSLITVYNTKPILMQISEDFVSSWYWILLGLMLAMVLSLFFMLLLMYPPFIVISIFIVGVLALGGYGIFYCYSEYKYFSTSKLSIMDLNFRTNVSVYFQVKETWLVFLIMLIVIEVILVVILDCFRKRLCTAVALLDESNKAIRCMMSTLAYPLITFLLVLLCGCYWAMTSFFLATSGAPLYRVVALNSSASGCRLINSTDECHPQTFESSAYPQCPSVRCIFNKYDDEGVFQQNIVYLHVYNTVAFLWSVVFVIALGQSTLAGTFASYYWVFNKRDIPACRVYQAFIRTLYFHFGSLALGSLLLTIFQLPRMILECLYHKFKDFEGSCGLFVFSRLHFGFWCFGRFLNILNQNAFVMMAIYGENFYSSARLASDLVMRNVERVVLLDRVTDVVLLFCKLLVVGPVGVLSFYVFSGRIRLPDAFQAEMLNYYWVQIVIVTVGAYIIAQGFFSVYSMCVNTLSICLMEDLERNDGSLERPYYSTRNLMTLLHKSRGETIKQEAAPLS